MKTIVREVVERLLPVQLAAAGIDVGGGGGGGADGSGDGADGGPGGGGEMSLAEKLCALPHQAFMQLLLVISRWGVRRGRDAGSGLQW